MNDNLVKDLEVLKEKLNNNLVDFLSKHEYAKIDVELVYINLNSKSQSDKVLVLDDVKLNVNIEI